MNQSQQASHEGCDVLQRSLEAAALRQVRAPSTLSAEPFYQLLQDRAAVEGEIGRTGNDDGGRSWKAEQHGDMART